jgi:hypothetical protein
VRRRVDLAREAPLGRMVARAAQLHVEVALDEPAARAQAARQALAGVEALDERAAVQEAAAVEVLERRDELVGVDLRIDVQRVEDVRARQPGVQERLAEGMDDRLLGGPAQLAARERERACQVRRVSRRGRGRRRRRRRPRRRGGSRSGPPRS